MSKAKSTAKSAPVEAAPAPKVRLITCAATGEVFEHIQTGRGRPPVYSPAERARRAAEGYTNPVLRLALRDGPVAEGDKALFVPASAHRNRWFDALRFGKMVEVVSVSEDTATVRRDGQTFDAPVRELIPAQ